MEDLNQEHHRPQSHSKRGFASMGEDKQRKIASQGGKSVPAGSRSFSKNRDLARSAGKKGGERVPPEERSFSKNRELAREAGRKGGEKSRQQRENQDIH